MLKFREFLYIVATCGKEGAGETTEPRLLEEAAGH